MITRKDLPERLRLILNHLDARDGASVAYLQRVSVSKKTGNTMTAPALRAAIGRLRSAGYDITFGVAKACDGRSLYQWNKSPVALPQGVSGSAQPTS